jgi:hypothetical protein
VSGTSSVQDQYSFTVQAVDAGGVSGVRDYTLTIGRTDQTITVTKSAPATAVNNTSFAVAASASSGLGVSITASGACSGSGTGTATITMTGGSASCVVLYSQAGNANYTAAQKTESASLLQVLTITPLGAGAGRVSGNGLDCAWNGSSSGGICSLNYLYNSKVSLSAAAGACSFFTQWGNSCSGTGSACLETMTQDRAAEAFFGRYPRAWFAANTDGYQTLADTYAHATDGAVIRVQATSFAESLVLGRAITVSFDSGWSCDYAQRTGAASLKGLTVSGGSLKLLNGTLVIGP